MDKSNAQKTFGTLTGKKILIVDDEQMNQLVISNMVKRWGAQSTVAENGTEAIEKLKTDNFDIILMDLMMPGLDGYQTSEKIRKELNPNINQIPILALTGTSGNIFEDKLSESGINDFAAKPFKIEELHAKISSLISSDSQNIETEDSENSQIINLDYLKETTSGNHELMKEIINIFLNQTPGFLERLDSEIMSENWNEVKTVAHKMKPTVSYVGISSIENTIKNIEDYSEQKNNLNEIPQLFTELKSKCENAFIELKRELEKIS